MPEQTSYRCRVSEVFSGDDLIAFIDLGVEDLWLYKRLRLAGVDTPPAIKAGDNTEGGKIRTMVRNLTRDRKAKLTVTRRGVNSWAVILVVETPSGEINLNDYLIAQGYKYQPQDQPEKV